MMRIGIDLGGTNITAGLVDENKKIVMEKSVKTALPRSAESIALDMGHLCDELLKESNLTYEWTLNGDRLTHVFHGAEGNQAVPKVYTVKEISESTMRWQDDYSMEYSFTKTE